MLHGLLSYLLAIVSASATQPQAAGGFIGCWDPEGNCDAVVGCKVLEGACYGDADCPPNEVCRPGCFSPSYCECLFHSGDWGWTCTFDCIGLCEPAPVPTGPRGYSIIDLGTFGGRTANANAINNLGDVVGTADQATAPRASFFWRDGEMTQIVLEIRPAVFSTGGTPAGINRDGKVILNISSEAYLWQHGVTTRIFGFNPGGSATVEAINEAGQVIGSSPQAFLWEAGGIEDLTELIGQGARVTDINNLAQVAGFIRAGEERRAMFWAGGTTFDLGTLGGSSASAAALNDFGCVVGASRREDEFLNHAFLWRGDGLIDLGLMGDLGTSSAADINNCGEIIINDFLYREDIGFKALESVIAAELRWYDFNPSAINDRGQIVGAGSLRVEQHSGWWRRAFLMTPEPGDLNIDASVNLADFRLIQPAFSPQGFAIAPGCLRGDLDFDGDTNLADFGVFQIVFTGPG